MQSRLVLMLTSGALLLTPVHAQANFPEQPSDNVDSGCQALLNRGVFTAFGVPGVLDGLANDRGERRLSAQYADACLE